MAKIKLLSWREHISITVKALQNVKEVSERVINHKIIQPHERSFLVTKLKDFHWFKSPPTMIDPDTFFPELQSITNAKVALPQV